MIGGSGSDTFEVDNVNDVVDEAANVGDWDNVYGGPAIDAVKLYLAADYTLSANVENVHRYSQGSFRTSGNAESNLLVGYGGNDTLEGFGGNDTLDGGYSGTDSLIGGLGDDIYQVGTGGDIVYELADEGTDMVYVNGPTTYTLTENVENGQLSGAGSLTGNALSNVLSGMSQNVTLQGAGGDDTYLVDTTTDLIVELSNGGVDTVRSTVSFSLASINHVENLSLLPTGWYPAPIDGTGNGLANVITGNNGANRLDGAGGADRLVGGFGNDTYVVDNVDDQAVEVDAYGVDTVESSVSYSLASLNQLENLTLTGSAIAGTGNDRNNLIIGNASANTLSGGAGNDTLNGGAGNDSLIGGLGDDTYVVDVEGDVVTELANGGTDTVQSAVSFDMSTVGRGELENLTLFGSATSGTGNARGNVIVGNGAANTLYGNEGDDTLEGGLGDDALNGGAGSDTASYAGSAAAVTVNLQTRVVTGAAGTDTLVSIENASGGAGNDSLIGDGSGNTLYGGMGSNVLQGGGGDDTYILRNHNLWGYDYYNSDTVVESLDQGVDTVKSYLSYVELGANVENLVLDGLDYYDDNSGELVGTQGHGNSLNNIITGNATTSQLWGGGGNDTLDGQAGIDALDGGVGSDTYMMGRGYDVDTIAENDATAGNTDVARFLSGIAIDQLWFKQVGDDLQVSIIGTGDKLLVDNWYLGSQYQVEQFKTVDGARTLLATNVHQLVNAMAAFSPPAAGQTTLPPNYQTGLASVIAANWQ